MGGLLGVHKAHIAAAIRHLTGRPVVLICPDELDAARLAADIGALAQEDAQVLSAREFNFYNIETVSREWEQGRIRTLYAAAKGYAPILATSADALLARTIPPQVLLSAALELTPGMKIPPEELGARLLECGYKRSEQVEGPGQFARRGGIFDFYSPGMGKPVRLEFFGDEIDTLSYIDTDTQRRVESADKILLLPAAEVLPTFAPGGIDGLAKSIEKLQKTAAGRKNAPDGLVKNLGHDLERLREQHLFSAVDRYISLIYPGFSCFADYIPKDAVILFDEHARLRERVKNLLWQHGQDIEAMLESGVLEGSLTPFYLDWAQLNHTLGAFDTVFLDSFVSASFDLPPRAIYSLHAKQLPSYGGSLETAVSDIEHYLSEGYSTVVLCPTERRAQHLQGLLEQKSIRPALDFSLSALPPVGGLSIALGSLSAGLEYPAIKLCVITEGQLTQEGAKAPRARRKRLDARRIGSYADLSVGDLVVHEHHGIGRFAGIVKMPVDGVERDYVKIVYAGTDSLYVPVTQLDLVSKYIGAGEDTGVRLNKLGGTEWNRAKTRARAAVADLAKQLIELYAQRKRQTGFSFPPDSDWQLEFEEAFEYSETDDQLKCTAEIKADMESQYPMDRLLCGDVGFGKTEVALRAVMKCVLGGKQAALLVPTTVLANQHFLTAVRRFSGYPVRVEMMSRFRNARQIKETVRKIKTGETDLVIGTHRLLQKDIVFKNLGLLIVDEEQRFGVTHKERLKEMARQVDVLTLTATPIPRTLNMALSGMRDMSVIEDPPHDRHPVQTYVLEHDWSILADAIRREVSRGGQVYYLHNRVESIDRAASKILSLLPGVTVGVAHGQMSEEELADVMQRTFEGEINVLVCTTIIETGIDIPNVNTLIIEDADRLGLAQLHQIRGRVGRSSRHAYAYMTFRRGKVLTEIATKRLNTVREFAEFGSGFKIALRDLEIRGAGNVLGAEQHGHMVTVGYDMYLKLLEEAILENSPDGKAARRAVECTADLSVPAGIPERFIPSSEQRLDIYRRIAGVRDDADASDLLDELVDRYGDVPRSVDALVRIALLREAAAQAGIAEISQKGPLVSFRLAQVDFSRVSALCAQPAYKRRLLFNAGERPYLALRLNAGEDVLQSAAAVVKSYAESQ